MGRSYGVSIKGDRLFCFTNVDEDPFTGGTRQWDECIEEGPTVVPVHPVSEPSPVGLILLGLIMVAVIRKRNKEKQELDS